MELSKFYHALSALHPISFFEMFLDSINIYNIKFTFIMNLGAETYVGLRKQYPLFGCLRRMESGDNFCCNSPAWNFMKIGLSVLQPFCTYRETWTDGWTDGLYGVPCRLAQPPKAAFYNSCVLEDTSSSVRDLDTLPLLWSYDFLCPTRYGNSIAVPEFSSNPLGISSLKVTYSWYNVPCKIFLNKQYHISFWLQ